jgi:hypothetical protein
MTTLLAHAVFLILATVSGAPPAFDPYAGPKPLAVWIQTDPWLWVIGSDVPRAVLYEDGELVFIKVAGRRTVSLRHRKVGRAELEAFKGSIGAAVSTSTRARYELAEITDQPSALIYARSGERTLATEMYGVRAEDAREPASAFRPVPREVHALFRLLASVDEAGSTEWQPRYVEVMLQPYRGPEKPVLHSPADWPGLTSERTRARHDGQYSIYMDAAMKPRIEALLDQQKTRGGGAIEHAGKSWFMRTRLVFPGEPIWREAFLRAEEPK